MLSRRSCLVSVAKSVQLCLVSWWGWIRLVIVIPSLLTAYALEKDVVRVIFDTHPHPLRHSLRKSELDIGMVCARNTELGVKSFTFHSSTSEPVSGQFISLLHGLFQNAPLQAFNRAVLAAFVEECGPPLLASRTAIAHSPEQVCRRVWSLTAQISFQWTEGHIARATSR